MSNEQEALRRPYAATANILAILDRIRSRNVPETIGSDFYRVAQLPDAVYGRVAEALRFLDMIREDGSPTDTLHAIAGASADEYQDLLAGAIRAAYADDFQNIDPSEDPQGQIIDWFRRYEPRSQTNRMVMLLLGLSRAAGIPVRDAPRERKQQSASRRPAGTGRTPAASRRQDGKVAGKVLAATGTLFDFTEADVAALDEDEFNEVWAALGKVARARARAKQAATVTTEADENNDE